MRPYLAFLLTLIAGASLGLYATSVAVEKHRRIGAVQAGPWLAWPRAGSPEADPYSRALQARTGFVPLGAGEGMALFAFEDQEKQPLRSACRYRIHGPLPSARYWTLMLYAPDGAMIETPLSRNGFTSAEVTREDQAAVDIRIAQSASPGNWLQPPSGSFAVVLRLYDTAVSANAFALDPKTLPSVEREGCP